MAPWSGFEPESKPRQGFMIGRYTTRACEHPNIELIYMD